ncbi:ABC-type transport auxiliary lipoprotein family protein [Alcaligenes faecalis]|uniref:ABC-type transport auxiliary lipoprotein family protein n=1 Tax=Alcaligenes faecalis TaxID=511 RepID=UPI0018D03C47|nr:ABC-type transport auxiliary lipoprotein family protein [Alcaligenes faecalis]MBH0309217.1 membrane integrity-associated transporter subunit PqiC [Alcaligenes faecalis]
MMPTVVRRFLQVSLVGLAVLSTACSVLPQAESLTYYQLPATSLKAQQAPASHKNLIMQVNRPHAERLLASSRITVLPQGNELSAYKGVRWGDDVPALLRNRLADALRDSAQFRAVVLDIESVIADVEVGGTLGAFQVEYIQGAPRVRIQFDALVRDQRSGQLIQTRRFVAQQDVVGTAVPQVVEAFGLATDALSLQVSQWLASLTVQAPAP